MKHTFRSGVHPDDRKGLSCDVPISLMPAPSRVFISLGQHIGKCAKPVVGVGDAVKRGTLIAEADGAVSANVHSSVSGTVSAIVKMKTTWGNTYDHIVIDNDGQDTAELMPTLDNPSADDILNRVRDAGIVGMGGAGFPTAVKLSPSKPIDTFLINAAECEPYITCDYRVMLEYTSEFLAGSLMLARVLGLDRATIVIEDNKPAAVEAINNLVGERKLSVDVIVVHTKYPQGAEKQLIFAATGRKVPAGGLPMDVGVVVSNVNTALATFRAVNNGEALCSRVVTVSGKGVKPHNVVVPVGALYSDVIEFCGGAGENVVKLVSGGPMMGDAIPNANFAITKTSGSLLLLEGEECFVGEPSACINCAKCVKACPMSLMPMYIESYARIKNLEGAVKYGLKNCIECGCCAYVCPAKRPLVASIRAAKKQAREAGI